MDVKTGPGAYAHFCSGPWVSCVCTVTEVSAHCLAGAMAAFSIENLLSEALGNMTREQFPAAGQLVLGGMPWLKLMSPCSSPAVLLFQILVIGDHHSSSCDG